MSVIQNIRDKYARWAVIAIAISLIGFLLMDAFAGRTGLFSNNGPGNTLGKVNGQTIDRVEFVKEEEAAVNNYTQQGGRVTEEQREQLRSNMWEQKVMGIIMEDQFEKLGLEVTDKEIRNELISNPPQEFRERYTDDKGNFNAVQAQQEINSILKDEKRKESARNYLLQQKYMVLFTNTVNYPKWFVEKKSQDASLMSKISYVTVPYATVDDKSVKVTDEDVQNYINNHKKDFEQKEETRTISFVAFNAAPTSADSAAIKAEVEKLREPFATDTNTANYVSTQMGQGQFDDVYLSANEIQSTAKDTILKQPVGSVYGPYIDMMNGKQSYVLAKIVAEKQLPDTVKSRHILIATADPQTGQPKLTDSAAKKRADSIAALIQAGQNFDSLVVKFTDDAGSKDKGGVYTMSSKDIQTKFVKEFGDYILFEGKPGDKKVVKTQFGYHYIEVMEHKNVVPRYKIAFVGKEIIASEATESDELNKATLFAGDSRDVKSFDENYDKKLKSQGILKSTATVTPLGNQVMGIQGNARSFVRKIYEADNGDVLSPERIGDQYIVAVITSVNKPGLQSVAQVRPGVEGFLMNKKKAEQIIKNIGQITTLEAVSSKTGKPIETLDSIRFDNPKIGYEPRVAGAAFNLENKGKVVTTAIEGTNGVYVVRVDNITTVPVEGGSIEDQQKQLEAQNKSTLMPQYGGSSPIINALKKSASIKDYRYKYY